MNEDNSNEEFLQITLKITSPEWALSRPPETVAAEILGSFVVERQLASGDAIVELVTAQEVPRPTFWAVAYAMDRVYGGPEEGGWWYNVGQLEESKEFTSEYDARAQAEAWRISKYRSEGNLYSVAYEGGAFQCYVTEDTPEEYFPSEKPHYE